MFEFEQTIILRILIAGILGALIGYERGKAHKFAGLRTHSLVAIGSCLFTLISIGAFTGDLRVPGYDPSRIISNVIVGIGFVGAGAILRQESKIIGLTTAASLWVVASIGVTIGVGFYLTALVVTGVVYFILSILQKIEDNVLHT